MSELTNVIKKVAEDARKAAKPSDIVSGTVKSVKPIQIQINAKNILDDDFLLLSKNVRKYDALIEINGEKHKCTIDNSLNVGDIVLMLRKEGAQKYIVFDKVVNS